MTSINRSRSDLGVAAQPALPRAGTGPSAPESRSGATHPAAEPALAPAQLSALDAMMQAFLADGKLDETELVAYRAARAAFSGGWDAVPAPPVTADSLDASDDDVVGPAAGGGGPSAGLAGAIEDYRKAILAHDRDTAGVMSSVLAGLTSGGPGPIHFLPGMMDPNGIRLLAWAALDREPTEDEVQKAKALLAADAANGAAKVVELFLSQAADRAAVAARLVWPGSYPQDDTPEARAERERFTETMRQGMQGGPAHAPGPAPAPAPAGPAPGATKPPTPVPAPIPAPPMPVPVADYAALAARAQGIASMASPEGQAAAALMGLVGGRKDLAAEAAKGVPYAKSIADFDGNNWGAVAMVGPYDFHWAGRPYAGLLGGWDNATLGKTYSTADALDATGGYNDLHYYPECQDPAYKAIWELMLAANTGDKAAWSELAQLKLEGHDVETFLEQRSYWVADPVMYEDRHTPVNRALAARLADRVQAARDRWKAGGTEVVLANDPQFAVKTQPKIAEALKEHDALIAIAASFMPKA